MIKGLRPLAAIALLTAVGLVAAQGYPNKPVTIVVPFTAGGPTATQEASKDSGFRTRISELGATVYPVEQMTPAALASHLKSEIEKWGPVIKKAGVYAD
ncbi:MAG: hypothetical protein ACXW16_00345 [Burkholderiaceae bacterium]